MKRYLEVTVTNGTIITFPIDYIPSDWTEKQVQREFAEYLVILMLKGEDKAYVGQGIQVPIADIEDFHLVEK